MRDICERTAVDKRRRSFQRLYQIRLQRILQKRRHRALRVQHGSRHRFPVIGIADDHFPEALLQITQRGRKTQHRHHLRRYRDVKAVLPRHPVDAAAQAVRNIPQLAVIHIDAASPRNPPRINPQRVSLINMIVQHCRKQIICGADRMKISRKMQVDLLHGNNLGVSASRSSSFYSEHRAQRRFPERNYGTLPKLAKSICQSDGRRRFSFSGRRRRNGSYQHKLSPLCLRTLRQGKRIDFCFIFSIMLQTTLRDSRSLCDFGDRPDRRRPGDFDITLIWPFVVFHG